MKLQDYLNFEIDSEASRNENLAKVFGIPIDRMEELFKLVEIELTVAKMKLASEIARSIMAGDKNIGISKFIFLKEITHIECNTVNELLFITEVATTEAMALVLRLERELGSDLDPYTINQLLHTLHQS